MSFFLINDIRLKLPMGWVPFQLLYLGPFSNVRCKALALKRFQDEELRKLQNRNSSSTKSLRSAKKPKAVKPQENKQPELSLFDL